jgi:hypothetical protein
MKVAMCKPAKITMMHFSHVQAHLNAFRCMRCVARVLFNILASFDK